ncbi:MAG TPA: proline racemase family protein [Candidatus Dormibacteraeota bacterium]|nr:proline racemase family protein [Candidatus Dormibacteraeota bacterium]
MTLRVIETIDTHTLGEPTRIVLKGFPELRGRTLKDRSRDLLRRHSDLRRALMWEPRGHLVMFGAVVVPPADPAADLGLVFMDGGGAVEMCVHGTIGAVTALVETGRLKPPRDGVLTIDTPAAPVRVRVRRSKAGVSAVELEGVPSRSVATGLRANAAGREVVYDLAYGGNLIAIVRGADLGIKVQAPAFRALVDAGMEVKAQVQKALAAAKGRLGPWNEVVSTLIYSKLAAGRYRDLVVFRDHSVDRSPCGSCFSALMAQLHATRKLRLDEWVECENLLGLFFRGRLVDCGGELIPQLSGSAFITGEHRFHIDSRDPLRHGFQLG